MIIGIDASRANKTQKTGVEWYSYYLIQAMKKVADESDRFVLYSREPLRGGLKDLPPNFESRVLKWPPKFLWTHLRLSWEMLTSRPDVLFVPAHVIPAIHPKKTITTCHDVGFERYPRLYSPKELKYQKWAVRFALKHAAKIITISEFTKKELTDAYNANPDKIEVTPLSYNKEIYRPIDDREKISEVLKRYKIEKPYILYVGRMEQKKNVLGLLKAFRLISESYKPQDASYRLVLVGQPGYGYEEIAEYIAENDSQDSIIMPGWVGEEDLPYLMNGAELFVFPSFYEGFGIPVLEAMACGTPVVASNAASIPEVAGEAAVLFDPKNPEEMAGAMRRVLESEVSRKELREKGLLRAKEFSWEKCAKETLRVIKLKS